MRNSDPELLKKFMNEFFPFNEFLQAGFFTKTMKGNYPAQAKRVCEYFGYKIVYEYGIQEIRCHLTQDNQASFVCEVSNIYK